MFTLCFLRYTQRPELFPGVSVETTGVVFPSRDGSNVFVPSVLIWAAPVSSCPPTAHVSCLLIVKLP